MLLLRRVKLRLAQRAGLKRQVNLVKPVAANIARAVVKAADGSVSISSRKNMHERFKKRVGSFEFNIVLWLGAEIQASFRLRKAG